MRAGAGESGRGGVVRGGLRGVEGVLLLPSLLSLLASRAARRMSEPAALRAVSGGVSKSRLWRRVRASVAAMAAAAETRASWVCLRRRRASAGTGCSAQSVRR